MLDPHHVCGETCTREKGSSVFLVPGSHLHGWRKTLMAELLCTSADTELIRTQRTVREFRHLASILGQELIKPDFSLYHE